MALREFTPITFQPSDHGPELSSEVYAGLRKDVQSSKHSSRFELRPLSLNPSEDCPSPFDVDIPYLPPIETTDEHREILAALASSLVMRDIDWKALVVGFKTVYEAPEVKSHLSSGGVVKFIDSHRTYTGQVMQQIASWDAKRQLGVEAPHEIQTTIISRVTTLFRLSLLQTILENAGRPHHDGAIVEDVLLQYGGALLTIPNTQSGIRLVQMIQDGTHARSAIVERTKTAYPLVINRGGSDGQIMFEGSSGTENHVNEDGTHRIIDEVKKRTVELTTDYNQDEGLERVMAIGVFMDSDPYTGNKDNPLSPNRPTPFGFLEPRYPKTQRDFDQMMRDMAHAGTILKASGELPYRYADRSTGKNKLPEFIFKHTV
jgi:hypothetical protein